MKYSIFINQTKALEWEINLQEATLIDLFSHMPTWAKPEVIENEIWYFFAKNKILDECPILSKSGKIDTIYKQTRSLVDSGFLKFKKIGIKDYWQLTDKIREWNFKEDSEKNPSEVGKKSEESSEKNPTYNNTNSNQNTNDNKRYFEDSKINDLFLLFIENRKQMRKKMTDIAIDRMVKKIDGWIQKHGSEKVAGFINTSIENGWQGIFEKEESTKPGKPEKLAYETTERGKFTF